MRPVIVAVLACLALTACGSSERKTVIITPPAGSTTVVDQDGHAHTTRNN